MEEAQVRQRISEISDEKFLNNVQVEILELHTHLFDTEIIEAIAQGKIENKYWLITVTNKRLFAFHKIFKLTKIDISISAIKSISINGGFIMSDLLIDTGTQNITISAIPNPIALELQNAITCLMHGEPVKRIAKDTTNANHVIIKETTMQGKSYGIPKKEKSIFVKFILFILVSIFCLLLYIFVYISYTVFIDADDEPIPEQVKTLEQSTKVSKYKTDADWGLRSNACIAVEISDYSGDIFEAGTYKFYIYSGIIKSAKVAKSRKLPIMYGIYISDEYRTHAEMLTENELVGTVGGMGTDAITIDLKKGQYVYIVYHEIAADTIGYLNIEKQ